MASHNAEASVTERLTSALLTCDPRRDLEKERLGEKKRITGYVVPEPEWLEPEPEAPP